MRRGGALLVGVILVGGFGSGCEDEHRSRGVSLALHATVRPDLNRIDVSAEVSNDGDVALFYQSGCTACSYPQRAELITFVLFSDGHESGHLFLPSYPCGTPTYCPAFLQRIAPGDSQGQTLMINGTVWDRDRPVCVAQPSDCTEVQLATGRYELQASFIYWTEAGYEGTIPVSPMGPATLLEKSVFVDWQGAASITATPTATPPAPTHTTER